jgi:predicted nuclease of predicted toxin-antitoxin system
VRLVIDECVKGAIADALAPLHELHLVARMAEGLKDGGVIALAKSIDAVLVTEDRGIPWQARLAGEPFLKGVVLFRLDGLSREEQARRALAAMEEIGSSILGKVTIVEPSAHRQRDLLAW